MIGDPIKKQNEVPVKNALARVLLCLVICFLSRESWSVEILNSTTAETVNYQSYSGGQWKSGQQVYQAFCVHCHQANIGPVLLGRHYSPMALTFFVRHGINTMPTFRVSEINDAELALLAKWIEQSPLPMDNSAMASGGTK